MDARNSKQSRKTEWFELTAVAHLRVSKRVIRIFIDSYAEGSSSFEGFASTVPKASWGVLLRGCASPVEKATILANAIRVLNLQWVRAEDGICISCLHMPPDKRGPCKWLLTNLEFGNCPRCTVTKGPYEIMDMIRSKLLD